MVLDIHNFIKLIWLDISAEMKNQFKSSKFCECIKIHPFSNVKQSESNTGIPRSTLLMWGSIQKTAESKNRINRGYSVVLKGRKIG